MNQDHLYELEKCVTADDIASLLIGKGVRGERGYSDSCPLTHFLEADSVNVSPLDEVNRGAWVEDENDEEVHKLRGVCIEFLDRFDAGEWSELVLGGALSI